MMIAGSEPVLHLNEFFVEGGEQEKSHVLLHITEPSTPEEKKKGYFFAVAEINNAETKHITRLQEIIDEIENSYYETPDEDGKTSLEIVLEKINQTNNALANKGLDLNCVVGAIRQPEIFFSFYGNPLILLFYKNRQELYEKMNLIDAKQTSPAEPEINPEYSGLFSQIVQGKISPQDYLLTATPKLLDYFNTDRLQKLITSRPIEETAKHVERVLTELQGGLSFGGLIIHLSKLSSETAVAKKTFITNKGASEQSLNNLFVTEKNTARTLSPAIFKQLSEKIKATFPSSSKTQNRESTTTTTEEKYSAADIKSAHLYSHRPAKTAPARALLTKEQLNAALHFIWIGLSYLGRAVLWLLLLIWSILQALVRNLALLFFIATNYQSRRKNILENWGRQWRSYRIDFNHLPLTTKILLIGSIFLALTFLISLLSIRAAQTNKANQMAFQTSVSAIKTKIDSAESALIYKNEPEALADVTEALKTLSALNCRPKDAKVVCQDLTKQLNDLLTKARKITTVSPTMLINWNNAAPMSILKINSKIFAYSAQTSTIFAYDLLTKDTRTLMLPSAMTGFVAAAAPKENDYGLFVYHQNQLWQINPVNLSSKAMEISFPDNKTDIKSAAIYNRRLYALDTAHNQIYKHDSIKNGFGPGKEWLRDKNISVSTGMDLTIDGDIFVLTESGGILKITGGVAQPFTIKGLDPALKNGGKIWTYNDLNYLYVLDPIGKRLIVLNKDGVFKEQLTAPQFNNPTGLSVDEPNHIAYIMDEGKLYKINLP